MLKNIKVEILQSRKLTNLEYLVFLKSTDPHKLPDIPEAWEGLLTKVYMSYLDKYFAGDKDSPVLLEVEVLGVKTVVIACGDDLYLIKGNGRKTKVVLYQ